MHHVQLIALSKYQIKHFSSAVNIRVSYISRLAVVNLDFWLAVWYYTNIISQRRGTTAGSVSFFAFLRTAEKPTKGRYENGEIHRTHQRTGRLAVGSSHDRAAALGRHREGDAPLSREPRREGYDGDSGCTPLNL